MSTDDRYDESAYDEDDVYGYTETYDQDDASAERTAYDQEDESWWDEDVIGLIFIAGVILLLFPEPATSTVGLLLIVFALGAWIADIFT